MKENIILIFPDQWRGDSLSCLDHPVVETPYIDQLAFEGMVFDKAYTPAPTCIPARAALATGKTPSNCGRPGYKDGVPWLYPNTFMRLLRDNDYQTMGVGKTHFYPMRAKLGFEELSLYQVSCHADPDCTDDDYHPWLREKSGGLVSEDYARESDPNSMVVRPWEHNDKLHANTWTMDESIRLLERKDPLRPFFLQVNFQRPHLPLDPPRDYLAMYEKKELPPLPYGEWSEVYRGTITSPHQYCGDWNPEQLDRARRAYYAQLSHIDYQVGKLYYYLRKKKLLDNTWIIFTSDHGELLGDHYHFRKMNPLEGSAKIPFVVRPPSNRQKQTPEGELRRSDDLITLYDLFPTFMDIADLHTETEGMSDGYSLLPRLLGATPEATRKYLHIEHARLTYDAYYFTSNGFQCVVDADGKFIWDTLTGDEYFFDLKNDPQETVNHIYTDSYLDVITNYRKEMIRVLAERPQDGMSDGTQLIPGNQLPQVRPVEESYMNSKTDRNGITTISTDVIVVGGGPAGFSAAMGAARTGSKVIIIEKENYIGGLLTTAIPLNSFHDGSDTFISSGIPVELINRLRKLGGASEIAVSPGFTHYRSRVQVDTELMKLAIMQMLQEERVVSLLHSIAFEPLITGNTITGVNVMTKSGMLSVLGKVVIDASGDADIAAKAGVPIDLRPRDQLQPMTLLFRLGGVDLLKLRTYILDNPDLVPNSEWNESFRSMQNDELYTAYGFQRVVNEAREKGDLPPIEELPQRHIIFNTLPNGLVSINMAKVHGFDPLDPVSLSEAENKARAHVHVITKFLRKYIPGYENTYVVSTHNTIGIRESRRIIGKYQLSRADLDNTRTFPDAIAVCAAGMDVHSPDGKINHNKIGKVPEKGYEIPFRCLIPKKVDNLLAAGRSISADYQAIGAVRNMNPVMAIGQAAGVGAAMAVSSGCSVHELSGVEVRKRMQALNLF